MMAGEDYHYGEDDDYGINPYESFMKKHLQHYGYYTGKNQNYKNQFQQYAEWEKNYAYNLSSSSDDSASDSDEDDKNAENKPDDLRTTQLIYSYGDSGKMVPKLREPRSLYALNKELGPQQAARWPSDLQVINEKVHHIQTVPPEPEPFYKNTGYEKCPMVRGESNGGRVVFGYDTKSKFFIKSRVGGSRNGCDPCAVGLESDNDTTLIFESRFESGNLGKAVQIGETEYELSLRYDLYTNKHTQWFYFRVSNTRKDKEYRFTIINFMKPDSLYNNGMQPVMYSETEAALNKVGWVRAGQNIKYYKNNVRYEAGRADHYYYSMTWTVRFEHDHDTVYFSHCYPYTYTDLQDYLLEVSNDPIKSRICKQRVLCRTLAGNLVYILTITSASQSPEDMKHKKAVVVTARVHPGESNASWMMKGFLDFVTGSSADAKLLRDTFIFKVVPMLNPDGVIVGNYRCSLAGRDLNRNYKSSLKDAYPSVWHTKNMIRKLLQERDIIVYCDLHGHSRRQNVFIYGCEQSHHSNKRFHERIFPSMLNKNSPDKFCFKSCKFKVQKSKEGTGRVVMWNMGVHNSYTLEATFCGSSMGKKKGLHFSQKDFEMMGYHFCDTLLDYCDPDNTKYAKILVDLEDRHKMEVMTKIAQRGLQPDSGAEVTDLSDTESSDGGSDSSISDGPPVHLQYAAARERRRSPPVVVPPEAPFPRVRGLCRCFNDDLPKKKRLKSKKDRDKVRPPAKEDLKKTLASQEDKRMRHNQVKPLRGDLGKSQTMRYTSTSPKRPRSIDERTNSGIPVFVQERFEEKQQKRHDYLEALTAAYISNNIPIANDPAFVKLDQNYIKADTPSMDELLRAHLAHPASINPLDRRHKPHLLEVSAAQQRQTDALSRDKNSPIKTHPNPFDEKESPRKGLSSGHPKSQVPSQTQYVNYNTFSVSRVPDINGAGGDEVRGQDQAEGGDDKTARRGPHRDRVKSGRKSRKGMHEDDTGDEFEIGGKQTIFDTRDEQSSHTPRVQSAQGSKQMTTAVSGVQEMQKSLSRKGEEGDPTTGNQLAGEYIQKLIEETNEEIKDLTYEIQEDIEKKHQHKQRRSRGVAAAGDVKSRPPVTGTDKGQRMQLEVGYHGTTFVSDLGKSKHSEERIPGGYLAGRTTGQPHTSSASSFTGIGGKGSSSRNGEHLSYTVNTPDPLKLTAGPRLVVANHRPREMTIEEEARTRSLKRQASLNSGTAGVYLNGQSGRRSEMQMSDKDLLLAGESTPNLGQLDEEYATGSRAHRDLHSAHSASGVRLNKQTLVFRGRAGGAGGGAAEAGPVATPRGASQLSDHQEGDTTEVKHQGGVVLLYGFIVTVVNVVYSGVSTFNES
ncbi:cytosolic carboxypeptidase 2 [Aplysia californica]|uniref:Cytosolic carboxypeptidase 2 n=1 Tax=Aplysia californica TaxID=6500 RepID=A0ABM1W2F8_APLCA|nr:cytosolic carboxypeptidase 2 [Aplysia californica]